MRVTNSMMVGQFMNDSNKTLNRVQKSWGKVNSSKKITSIADDPLATISALKARNRLTTLSGYQDTVSTAKSYLTEAESSSGSLNSVLQSAYDLIVRANSGTKGEDEMQAISGEVANLRDEILAISNSSIGTSFLFGGDNTIRQPFSVNEVGTLFYNGINLSGMALCEDYDLATQDIAENITEIGELMGNLGSVSEYNARNTVCVSILDRMKSLNVSMQTAYDSAMKYSGMDTGYNFSALAGLKDMRDRVNDIMDRLYNEMTQELYTDTTGFDALELENGFRVEDCMPILDEFATLAGLGGGTNQIDATLTDAKIALPTAMTDQITEEQAVSKRLKVGPTTFIEVTANGLDFLGTGASNYYCLLDKCTRVLDGDLDRSLLSDMVGDLQNAISTNSTVRTKFGASLERIDMISERYTSSELTYTEMLTEAEDVDLAEAIMEWKTAQTVYDGALAAGSKIIQTSLLDFLK